MLIRTVSQIARLVALAVAMLVLVVPASARAQPSDYAQTDAPIILVHGGLGTSQYLGLADYFYGIPDDLRSHGAEVFVVHLSAVNGEGPDRRGGQLVQWMQDFMVVNGPSRFNLIGHSMGGLSSRYAATVLPENVVSVTTIGTPHKGMELFDFTGEQPVPVQLALIAALNLMGYAIGVTSGQPLPQDAAALQQQLSTEGSAAYNAMYPSAGLPADCTGPTAEVDVRNGETQLLYSWTGNASATNVLDPSDLVFVPVGLLIESRNGGSHDGFVSVCSARFGKELGIYDWNHFDEVNQILGLRGLWSADPVAVIRQHANRLKLAGL
ncbi:MULTISPECIES: esterase/lipase family protein [Cupriavidus]|uniref:Triacylglycerol lipase n=1 Tax=Cupriavidus pauculus TaxID=82633 RepID=A0A3G8H4T3_9BURK|nr:MULTISPECIES: triacylglycerol lipase [Cupriavidus]AZG15110.1 triacylglycerol lipase [Cupriavidus pauculus]MDT6961051.1 triacylglycerol lipase [Cupriavidus sp. SZY C1]